MRQKINTSPKNTTEAIYTYKYLMKSPLSMNIDPLGNYSDNGFAAMISYISDIILQIILDYLSFHFNLYIKLNVISRNFNVFNKI